MRRVRCDRLADDESLHQSGRGRRLEVLHLGRRREPVIVDLRRRVALREVELGFDDGAGGGGGCPLNIQPSLAGVRVHVVFYVPLHLPVRRKPA